MLINAVPFCKNFFDGGLVSGRTGRFFDGLIQETIRTRKERGIVRPDMIQLLIESGDVSLKDIVAQSFIFFLGGFDTTSTIMSLVAFELAGNPRCQEKLALEIKEFFLAKADDRVSYDELNKLRYLDQVVSETLRLYPPMLATDRICVKEHQLPPPMEGYPGYKVEVGSLVIMVMRGIHQDPRYFSEPEKFDPERFSDERKHEINPYAYIPFGLGPRKCIAERFAVMEVKIFIVYLLRKFQIKLAEGMKYPLVCEKSSVFIKPEGGCRVELVERKKND